LVNAVKRHRLVLLDGESGCGKSALVTAGLVPRLQQPNELLLSVLIRDWGEDWTRSALSSSLDALFNGLTEADRKRLGSQASPDLAADTAKLEADLNGRLKAVANTLHRRPLLITDQFDDYQAYHRERFLDEDGNWLRPVEVAKVNPFWNLVS